MENLEWRIENGGKYSMFNFQFSILNEREASICEICVICD
jgi:hypothetical protein